MRQTSANARVAGALLAIGGILFFIAGALHPHGMAVLEMLHSPTWTAAHCVSFVSAVFIILAIWLLLDEPWTADSAVARIGARLTIIGGLFMMVEFAVELAAHGVIGALATGGAPTMFSLFAAMHALGWPTFAAGFIVLILGVPHAAPAIVRIVGIIGAVALGLAGVLVAGFFLPQFGWLFIGGDLLAIWIVWAGTQALRRREAPAATPSATVSVS